MDEPKRPSEKAEALLPLLDAWTKAALRADVLASVVADLDRARTLGAELAAARAQLDQDRQATVTALMTGPVSPPDVAATAAAFAEFQPDGSVTRMYAGAQAVLRERAWSTARGLADDLFAVAAGEYARAVTAAGKVKLPAEVTTADQAAQAGATPRWEALAKAQARMTEVAGLAGELRRIRWVRSDLGEDRADGRRATPKPFLWFRFPGKLRTITNYEMLRGPAKLAAEIRSGAEPAMLTCKEADTAWWAHSGWTARRERDKALARAAGVTW